MPCDSIITNRVDLGKVNLDLLTKAMTALGVSASQWRYDGAQVIIQGARWAMSSSVANLTQAQIKQAYSTEVVKHTAASKGWQLKQVAPNKYQVAKR